MNYNSLISIFSWLNSVNKLMFVCLHLQMSQNIFDRIYEIIFSETLPHLGSWTLPLQFSLFYEKYPLDFADLYLKWLLITHIMFANTENRMTLRVLDTAQWQSCAAKLLSIWAIILLFGETQKCLYLSQISTDFNSVKKHLFASVLPHLLSTHLTSSFNIWMVQVWPRTFPLCSVIRLVGE